ncbi:MAG: universal stress protein [Betaproteobacteria bacterium HGW-Betaproteobacteria-10]|jgi:nucleotide-binding universal stress UspA family protein|nr:MAG: universal stress protein [Betaproteobacteria bacterium HGW-Betaproteobacteria-10]
MPIENKVLACVDRSHFANTIADAAAWAAAQMNAPLEFLHILDRHQEIGSGEDHSGAIGFDAQEHLLKTLSDKEAALTKKMREEGRLFLNGLRERAIAAGVPAPDTRQRYGHLEESLAEQEEGVRLFVLGRRGESAETTQRDLGRNVERVVRALHKPILTVTENFQPPKRFMIAFDGGEVTKRGVEMVANSLLFKGIHCHLLMSGKPSQDNPKKMDWARSTLETAGFSVETEIQPGDAETVIAKTIREKSIDLLIMGAFNHSPLRSLIFGSHTTDLLRSAAVPTLLLR